MCSSRFLCYTSIFGFLCWTLPGCAIVDQYSDRAAMYNIEAEQAQEKTILLNIVRASLRRPMQFTTISSIAGSASATGNAGYSLPVNIPFRNSAGTGSYPAANTWTAGGSVSGGETFTVPVLDTQEFYQGILKPIPSQYYDLLVQQRYPADLLFNLFIQKVVMRKVKAQGCDGDHTEDCEYTFTNYVSDNENVDEFQMFAHYLLRLGLTTEATGSQKDVPLKGAMNVNVKFFGSSNLIGSSAQSGASGQPSGGGAGGSQSAEPAQKNYKFCFSPKDFPNNIPSEVRCGTTTKSNELGATSTSTLAVGILGAGKGRDMTRIAALPECDQPRPDDDPLAKFCKIMLKFATQKVSFEFYTKSTQAVIYYLGEVARRQLYPDFLNDPQPIRKIMISTAQGKDIRLHPCRDEPIDPADLIYCQYLFRVENSLVPQLSGSVSGMYNGAGYSVPDYLHGGGYSMTSLEIIKQLLALFSSAKSLPQTNVLSVVSQ
jgi:hypothetical protein